MILIKKFLFCNRIEKTPRLKKAHIEFIIGMKKILILLCVCLFAKESIAYGQTGEAELNAPAKAYILSRFCTEVKYNFAFYDKLKFDWDSLCVASMPSLIATSSDEEFLKGMQILCNQLHDGHTYIFPTNNPGGSVSKSVSGKEPSDSSDMQI